jgi:hypothetical protein
MQGAVDSEKDSVNSITWETKLVLDVHIVHAKAASFLQRCRKERQAKAECE